MNPLSRNDDGRAKEVCRIVTHVPTHEIDKLTGETKSEPQSGKPQAAPRSRRVQSVDHAVDILQALAESPQGLGLSDIATQVRLSKATVHHLLATMGSRRLVARVPGGAQYRLNWGLYELGAAVVRGIDVTRIARNFLDQLATQTGESALLGILDGDSVLYLDRGDPHGTFRMVANAGRRSPLYSTASGKVLLANSTDRTLFDRLVDVGLAKLTPSTIVDPRELRQTLADVRQRGFATCWQEREVGLSSLAVPIRDYTGAVVASLALAGPASRLNQRTLKQHLRPLQQTGNEIGVRLGHGDESQVDGWSHED
ncbi:MAG: IclR family transcriptional regulator [Nakamurella sp.]